MGLRGLWFRKGTIGYGCAMPLFAVTVVGHDRPGIVAEVTEAIAALGGNLEDSSMTLLRGHFAMTLIATVTASEGDLEARLAGLSQSGLVVSVRELPKARVSTDEQRFLLSVHGGDRPGIVSAVAREVANSGGNITDLSTRLVDGFYVLVAEVALPAIQEEPVREVLTVVAGDLGVTVHFSPVEEDVM